MESRSRRWNCRVCLVGPVTQSMNLAYRRMEPRKNLLEC